MSFNTYLLKTGDGSTTDFTLPFTYDETSEVRVQLRETGVALPFIFTSTNVIRLLTAPASGVIFTIARVTKLDTPVVMFGSGGINRDTLNASVKQLLKGVQEAKDSISSTAGAKGDKGDTGAAGLNGTPGANGVKGDKGDTGNQGAQGIQGLTGAQGVKGDTGNTGAKGDKGDQGLPGAATTILGTLANASLLPTTGTLGNSYLIAGNLYVWVGNAWLNVGSIKGDTGAKGDTGNTGAQGLQGIQGIQGVKGDTGATGATGPAGTNGTNGATGATGAKGDTGATGPAGADGSSSCVSFAAAQSLTAAQKSQALVNIVSGPTTFATATTLTGSAIGTDMRFKGASSSTTLTLPTNAQVANGWFTGTISNETSLYLLTVAVPTGAMLDGVINGTLILCGKQKVSFSYDTDGWRTVWIERCPVLFAGSINASSIVFSLPNGYSAFEMSLSTLYCANAPFIRFSYDNAGTMVTSGYSWWTDTADGANFGTTYNSGSAGGIPLSYNGGYAFSTPGEVTMQIGPNYSGGPGGGSVLILSANGGNGYLRVNRQWGFHNDANRGRATFIQIYAGSNMSGLASLRGIG